MRRLTVALSVLLLAQLAILALVYRPGGEAQSIASGEPLLPATVTQLDEWQVSDNEGHSVALLKTADGWILPDLSGLPADSQRVEGALASLSDAQTGWPVANTEAAEQRFAVAPYLFERKLQWLRQGDNLATLYLGTSPGFRRVHARNEEQAAVHSIVFNAFDVPASAEEWLDKTLLQVKDPSSLHGPDYLLRREGEQWQGEDGKPPDERELEALLNALAYLQINGVASSEQLQTLEIVRPELTLAIEAAGTESELSLFTVGDAHYVRSSSYPQLTFTISAYDFDRFSSIDAQRLLSTAIDSSGE